MGSKGRPKVYKKVYGKTDGRCFYCGKRLIMEGLWHCEHMIPRSRGGTNTLENLVPACPSCNSTKGTKTVEELRTYLQWGVYDIACICIAKLGRYMHLNPGLGDIIEALEGVQDAAVSFETIRFYGENDDEATT